MTEAQREIRRKKRVLEFADCPDCDTTTREVELSRARAKQLLATLDGAVPASP
jgi:hypothetical protein